MRKSFARQLVGCISYGDTHRRFTRTDNFVVVCLTAEATGAESIERAHLTLINVSKVLPAASLRGQRYTLRLCTDLCRSLNASKACLTPVHVQPRLMHCSYGNAGLVIRASCFTVDPIRISKE